MGGGGGGFHDAVVFGSRTLGYFVVGYVRYLAQQTVHLVLSLTHLLVQLLVGLLHAGHLLLDGVGLVALALFHQAAYLSGQFLSLVQVHVQLLLGFTTFLVHGQHLVDGFLGTSEVLFLQAGDDSRGLFCNQFEC